MLFAVALVVPCQAADLILPGVQPLDQLQTRTGDVWTGLWPDHIAPVTVQVVQLEDGKWKVDAPGAPIALFRGLSYPEGRVQSILTAASLAAPLKAGELTLERHGTVLLVTDGERRQQVEIDDGTRLLWAGDLDQDGHPDLVLGGGSIPASLWLSSGSPYLLRQVAGFSEPGC